LIGARPGLAFAPRDWLLITDFDNHTGDPLFDSSLLTALTVSLEQSSHANVVPRARTADSLHRMGKSGKPSGSMLPGRPINHEYGMALFRDGDESKARETFELTLLKPDLKPKGLRSLAWLDLYHGKYGVAKPRSRKPSSPMKITNGS
jgi:hypothetical protein